MGLIMEKKVEHFPAGRAIHTFYCLLLNIQLHEQLFNCKHAYSSVKVFSDFPACEVAWASLEPHSVCMFTNNLIRLLYVSSLNTSITYVLKNELTFSDHLLIRSPKQRLSIYSQVTITRHSWPFKLWISPHTEVFCTGLK